ncbi:MAG: rhamnulokinase [Actinomycetota bacterium]|nr:rhamnulokinase [Actinomycetota bacterium]MDQ2956306.1 rhamnulokinase [Actinomycetota bacterium]
MTTGTFVAADLGASSGRVMLGRVGPRELDLVPVRRFRNGAVPLPDGLHWDVLGLYLEVLDGLRDAGRLADDITSVAIDSWAVDYGLLDASGALLGNPFHYRDARTTRAVQEIHGRVDPPALYRLNGLQHLPFNTIYQLAADGDRLSEAAGALLIPDLMGYWLSGIQVTEQTNASTTGLLDARTGRWADDLAGRIGLPTGLFPELVLPGTELGGLSQAVREATGLAATVRLSAVASHDTASAVAGVPAANDRFAYISCGTWGLVGVELAAPVLTEASRRANFTNERGVDGTVRYLRNVMGLWLLQESLRTWQLAGGEPALPALLVAAAELPAGGPIFDPDDPRFLPPGNMPERIAAVLSDRGERLPQTAAGVVRCILDSLAAAFADTVHAAASLSGQPVDVVHLVGGGSQNELLCQLTADACGLPVRAGPVEATAIGNVVVQARAAGCLPGDRWRARELVRLTHSVTEYQPRAR